MFYRLITSDQARMLERKDSKYTSRANYMAGDAHCQAVVRAGSELEARQVAAEGKGFEGGRAWLDESTTVELLSPDGQSELLGLF